MAKLAPELTPAGRVGQRVAGERLHQRAGEAEGDAGQQTGQSARQARVQHDSAISALTGSAEGGEYRADRQRFAPMVRLSAAAKASNSNNPGTATERTAVVENDITTSLI